MIDQGQQTTEHISDYSPLDNPVKKRDYTNHQVGNTEPLPELEEPTFKTTINSYF
jgi:hypothetical protein